MNRNYFLLAILAAALSANSFCLSSERGSLMGNINLKYQWDPNNLPAGKNPPHLASYEGHHVLKTSKYLEGYVELGQGPNGALRMTGPMTLTMVFQLTKQWPMRAALISKWGYMPGQAAYELGITADKKIYYQVSLDGSADNVCELVCNEALTMEVPTVVTAVYEPGKKIAIFINGQKKAEKTEQIPQNCYDGSASVRLGPRFEGLLAAAYFSNRAASDIEIQSMHNELSSLMPTGISYDKWKSQDKRDIIRGSADYLGKTAGVKLYKEIDISRYKGCYICPGDLNNDGKIAFVLYKNGNTYNVPGRLIAIDLEGKTLWEKGDASLTVHEKCGSAAVGEKGTSPALRGIVTVYDIDRDGKSEVISELWEQNKPMLYILDGATGKVKLERESPITLEVRQPKELGSRQSSRSHPIIRIAYLNGKKEAPCIVLKYEASNGLPCQAFALDNKLNLLWQIKGTSNSMGHIPTVADVDNDGKDEVVLGHMLADHDGTVLWDKGTEFGWHADTTAVAKLRGGDQNQILISVCGTGPVYCLDLQGDILWGKKREEISHGQAVWVGNFIEDADGQEIIACSSGHSGQFVTLRGRDGTTIAAFEHKKLLLSYPDFPAVVNWKSREVQSLWIPQDKILIDGRGNVVAELGKHDEYVQQKLHCGTSWRPVGAQALALDICGDEREELVLYEPYEGEAIFIFTQPDCDMSPKPYVAQPNGYNIRSYF